MQAKLLTAIEQRQVQRLGAVRPTPIDVRLICATNARIFEMAAAGTFREDLLYRINTIEIHLPPLRERGDDVQLLADHFVERFAQKYRKDVRGLSREARQKLQQYAWPGNVRELEHAVERAVILSSGGMLRSADFVLRVPVEKGAVPGDELNLELLERTAIDRAMKRSGGNVSRAAELLGITRFALYRKLNGRR